MLLEEFAKDPESIVREIGEVLEYLFLETPRVQPYDHPNAKWLKAPWLM